jgi:hypothetical protein
MKKAFGADSCTGYAICMAEQKQSKPHMWVIAVALMLLAAWMYFKR